jgi:hypothetical protein
MYQRQRNRSGWEEIKRNEKFVLLERNGNLFLFLCDSQSKWPKHSFFMTKIALNVDYEIEINNEKFLFNSLIEFNKNVTHEWSKK